MGKHTFTVHGLLGTLLFLAGFLAASWLTVPSSRAADAKDARIKALLRERLATLRDMLTMVKELDRNGMATPDQMFAANQAVSHAELDLCETDDQRLAILTRLVAEAKNFETLSHAPSVLALDRQAPLKAKVVRIEAEIALERARSK